MYYRLIIITPNRALQTCEVKVWLSHNKLNYTGLTPRLVNRLKPKKYITHWKHAVQYCTKIEAVKVSPIIT